MSLRWLLNKLCCSLRTRVYVFLLVVCLVGLRLTDETSSSFCGNFLADSKELPPTASGLEMHRSGYIAAAIHLCSTAAVVESPHGDSFAGGSAPSARSY